MSTLSAIDPRLVELAKQHRGEPTKSDIVGALVVGVGTYMLSMRALPVHTPGAAVAALIAGLWWYGTNTEPHGKQPNPNAGYDGTFYVRDGP